MDRLDALVHIAVLSKVIREIQHSDPKYEQLNVWPLKVFDEIYCKSLRNLCKTPNIRDEIVSKVTSSFATVKKEYDEFQAFKLEMTDILNTALITAGLKP